METSWQVGQLFDDRMAAGRIMREGGLTTPVVLALFVQAEPMAIGLGMACQANTPQPGRTSTLAQ